jgi:hypothetical protein
MKTSKWQQAVLLNDAGELSARQQAALVRQLERDPDLRAFAEDIQHARRAHRTLAADPGPHPFVIEQIMAAAQQHLQRPAPSRAPAGWHLWKPAMAYASLAIALLIAAHLFFARSGRPTMEMTGAAPALQAPPLTDPDTWDTAFETEWVKLNYELEMLLATALEYADEYEVNENDWAQELLEWETSS